MRIKSEIQGICPRIEVYPHKKRKHTISALIKNIKVSISRKGKRGQ